MFLNKSYYRSLIEKYNSVELIPNEVIDKFSLLNLKMILELYKNKQPIHINLPNSENILKTIGHLLFIELANIIFVKYPDLPASFNVGDKLKHLKEKRTYEIISKCGNRFTLREVLRAGKTNVYPAEKPGRTYDNICLQYIKIETGIRDSTIQNYFNFFKEINHLGIDSLIPTHFEYKSVFIATKTFYDSLIIKNKIPTTYFPNLREETNIHETKSIPALLDSIMFLTPKYKSCYDKILLQGKKIDTVVVLNTEETEIGQIIQDKKRFRFNLIVITNTTNPIKCSQLPCWNWYKEESEIINTL